MKRTGLVIASLGLFLFGQAALADWTPAKRLTWSSGNSSDPAIAIDSNNIIHAVWDDDTQYYGYAEIYYKRSTDGGITWSAAKKLTANSGDSVSPAIAIDSSKTIHVVWSDKTPGNYEIYYKRSTDGGTTWSASKRLAYTSGESDSPAIAIDSSKTIHVVWYDDTPVPGNYEIYYKRSTDGSTTWSASKRLTYTSGWSRCPSIGIDSSKTLHVVWEEVQNYNPDIYYKRSTDGGTTWSVSKRLTWSSGDTWEPAIAIDSGNNIHIVYVDATPGNWEIYYKKSTNSGATWSASKRLTWTSGSSWVPVIAIDSSNSIHVVWSDRTPAFDEIYYKKSTNGGTTWSSVKNLSMTSGYSYSPAIAIDSTNTIHLVWSDDTPGNYEIYYKKGK